jgi:hypothetical protein
VVIERDRWVRAVLVCTTCRVDVATGPACDREPIAAFELGRMAQITESILHMGVCAGGVLDVRLEEVPNAPPIDGPPRAHDLTVVYDDDEANNRGGSAA